MANHKMKFQLLGGTHSELGSKHEYKKGDIVESHHDLCAMWVGKFERVVAESEPPAGGAATIVVSIGGGKKDGKDEKADAKKSAPEDPRGDEVTDEFSGLDKSLRVFRRGEYFHLYKGKDKKPINDKGLKTDKEVLAAAKAWLDE